MAKIDLVKCYNIIDNKSRTIKDSEYLIKCTSAFKGIKHPLNKKNLSLVQSLILLREYQKVVQTITDQIFETEIKGD